MASVLRLARAAREAARAVGSGRITRGAVSPLSFCSSAAAGGPKAPHSGPKGPGNVPIDVDWVRAGAVTPLQDQGDCGACWSFATVATLESANFRFTKELIKLSEQQLIDGNNLRNFGCDGGSPTEALQYVIRNGGIVSNEDYPYTGVQGPLKPMTAYGVTITGFHTLYNTTELGLQICVAEHGPVIVSIGADETLMEHIEVGDIEDVVDGPNYTLDEMTSFGIAHAAAVVGYGVTLLGKKFWKVKNSHKGKGFLLLARDTGKIGGAFGITRAVTLILKREPNGQVVVKSDVDMGVDPRPFTTEQY